MVGCWRGPRREGGVEGEAGACPQQRSREASCREQLSRRISKVAVATMDEDGRVLPVVLSSLQFCLNIDINYKYTVEEEA